MLTAMLTACLTKRLIADPKWPDQRTARAVRHVSLTVIIEMITPMFTPLLTPSPWARFPSKHPPRCRQTTAAGAIRRRRPDERILI